MTSSKPNENQGWTLYDVLGISQAASPEEVRAAFRAAAKRCHPDQGGDPVEFMQAKAAYDVLSDATKRSRYDAGLRSGFDDGAPHDWSMESDPDDEFGKWAPSGGSEPSAPSGFTRAQRYGFPPSTSFARPSWLAIISTVITGLLLAAVVIELLTSGFFGILFAAIIVAALVIRIFSFGDALLARRILRVVVGLMVLFALFIFLAPGAKWPGVLVLVVAGMFYFAVERMRSYRLGSALRKHFLRFLDDVQHLPDAEIYYVEHAQPAGARTRVSLLDFESGVVAGPKSLWGVWTVGMIVAVDRHHRVVAATSIAGLDATEYFATVGA